MKGHIVLVMSVVAVILFVTEPVPSTLGGLDDNCRANSLAQRCGFHSSRPLAHERFRLVYYGLIDVGCCHRQTKPRQAAWRILIVRMTGTKTRNVATGIAIASGLMASVIGEHTVAAMMLPVAIILITLTSDDP